MSVGTSAKGTQPTLGPDAAKLVGLTLLALMAPAATLARNVLGAPGVGALAVVLASGILLLVMRATTAGDLPRRAFNVLLGAAPLLAVYALSGLANPSGDALGKVAQLVLVITFVTGMALVRWDRRALMPLFWVALFLLVGHLAWWAASGMPRIFRGFMGHPNGLAMLAYLLLAFPVCVYLITRRYSVVHNLAVLGILSGLTILYATTSRSAWLATIVSAAVILFWPALTRNRLRFQVGFALTCAGVLLGTWLYLVAPSTEWGWRLQELSVRYTSKNLFSGRHLFWDDLATAVAQKPLLGHGAGVEAQSITGFSWSAHNLYLQTTLQVGIVGLIALFLFLWVLWRQLWRTRHTVAARVGGAFFLGTLVHQMFEVSLTQVNLANGFLIWLLLAVGMNYRETA